MTKHALIILLINMLCVSEASVTLLVLQKKVKSRIDEVNAFEFIVLAIK